MSARKEEIKELLILKFLSRVSPVQAMKDIQAEGYTAEESKEAAEELLAEIGKRFRAH